MTQPPHINDRKTKFLAFHRSHCLIFKCRYRFLIASNSCSSLKEFFSPFFAPRAWVRIYWTRLHSYHASLVRRSGIMMVFSSLFAFANFSISRITLISRRLVPHIFIIEQKSIIFKCDRKLNLILFSKFCHVLFSRLNDDGKVVEKIVLTKNVPKTYEGINSIFIAHKF